MTEWDFRVKICGPATFLLKMLTTLRAKQSKQRKERSKRQLKIHRFHRKNEIGKIPALDVGTFFFLFYVGGPFHYRDMWGKHFTCEPQAVWERLTGTVKLDGGTGRSRSRRAKDGNGGEGGGWEAGLSVCVYNPGLIKLWGVLLGFMLIMCTSTWQGNGLWMLRL